MLSLARLATFPWLAHVPAKLELDEMPEIEEETAGPELVPAFVLADRSHLTVLIPADANERAA